MELKLFIIGCVIFVIAKLMQLLKKYFKIETEASKKLLKSIYSWADTIWTALIIASFIMFFFVQAFKIPSGSMRNTLKEGDHLFVNKCFYGFKVPFKYVGKRYGALKQIKRGDVVVFQCPPEALTSDERRRGITKDFIKRCIAVGGDKVEIRDKKLYLNDVFVEEVYAIHGDDSVLQSFSLFRNSEDYQQAWERGSFASVPPAFARDNFGPVIVPQGCYMMMGDNRDFSFDSRFWGPLPDKYIKWKAILLYWPVNRWKVIS
ncbi:MAG: signal peptidase I [Endomicrobium sp.]|jgi:signal peptidase I|nr:signal peptidase I [Endomicrobium sp.]